MPLAERVTPFEDTSMVRVEDFSCGYGKDIVLKDISFEVKAGQFIGLIGPNGSGKSTMIRAISGFLQPQKGVILLNGRAVSRKRHGELAKRLAVVTQSHEATSPFSVEEFVLLGRVPHWSKLQLLETKQDMEIAEKAMSLTGISHLRGRAMEKLSGGERQLARLARALAQKPGLLLLDEPTAYLDIGHQVQIMQLLKKLNEEETTIVAVLHDLNLASLYCERLVLLNKGRLRCAGRPEEVLTREIINEVYDTSIIVKKDFNISRPLVFPVC